MRDPEQSPDDSSTETYRKERGERGAASETGATAPAPSLGASIRGAVGSEGGPEDSSGSPGSDDDRAATEQKDGNDHG